MRTAFSHALAVHVARVRGVDGHGSILAGIMRNDRTVARIAIVGGGPGGYEAALVAAQLGAEVTVIEHDGLGGACVLTDCVPSKTLIASAEPSGESVDI